ncbi:hypothetical protein CVT24_005251 [Panaeolus cyanescens]|uniref:Uncharacterized protein n=1 Tax=Panaeolus cyanescens TaxID=181874 RepID=A0A409Y935_9AGAR|nr:hypothetical protein CVT24_005251 [Panaeolus cyanescens]
MHSPPSRNSPLGDIYFNHHQHIPFSKSSPSSSIQALQNIPQSPTEALQPQTPSAGPGANHYPSSSGVPRLPPILQVEKQQVTTSATQIASASRRRNEAHFVCPVPGCGSTFTRRFNLRGERVICDLIPKSALMFVNGQAVKRALLDNTTARDIRLFMPLNHNPTYARVVKRPLADWMLSTYVHFLATA